MPKRLVAIEDDNHISQLLELLLASKELSITSYNNGKEGLLAVRENPPDLLLLDIMMPHISGWDIYDILRAEPRTAQLPIMVLSVMQPSFERRVAFVDSKIDTYVAKPFDILSLRERINTFLHVSHWEVSEQPTPARPATDEVKPIKLALPGESAKNESATEPIQTAPADTPLV